MGASPQTRGIDRMVAQGKWGAPGAAGGTTAPSALAIGIDSALGSLPSVALPSDRGLVASLTERGCAQDGSMHANRCELAITLGRDRLLSALQHVTWGDVAKRTV